MHGRLALLHVLYVTNRECFGEAGASEAGCCSSGSYIPRVPIRNPNPNPAHQPSDVQKANATSSARFQIFELFPSRAACIQLFS
jgi:hypothetical protein